jgi:RNA polymerase primary sigma factor
MAIYGTEDSVGSYLKDIGKYKPLSSAEEIRLSAMIKTGDQKALDKMVKANLRFVVNVALNYRNQGMSLSDLIAVGNCGLLKAIKRFDGNKNFKFISYAVWWIRQAMLQALAEQSRLSRIPLNKVADIYSLKKVADKLESKIMRKPSMEEIANEANVALKEVTQIMAISAPSVSIDSKRDEESGSLGDVLESDDRADEATDYHDLQDETLKYLNVLNDREKKIVKYYFGLDTDMSLTLEEIGQIMELTRERVRQLKERAMAKLITAHSGKKVLW